MAVAMGENAKYLWKGAVTGIALSVGFSSIRIGMLGATIIPPGIKEGRFDADDAAMGIRNTFPVYRRGGLFGLFTSGITLGRHMMVKTTFLNSQNPNEQSWYFSALAHERAHVYQQKRMGKFSFYMQILYEYLIDPGYSNDKTYIDPRCLDYEADQYMLRSN